MDESTKKALRDVHRTILVVESAKELLEKRRDEYDWGGKQAINDTIGYLDSCIEGIKILEENAKERYI